MAEPPPVEDEAARRRRFAGPIEAGIEQELNGVTPPPSLLAIALNLARSLDAGAVASPAMVARELRTTLDVIKKAAPAAGSGSALDQLAAARAARGARTAAPAGADRAGVGGP